MTKVAVWADHCLTNLADAEDTGEGSVVDLRVLLGPQSLRSAGGVWDGDIANEGGGLTGGLAANLLGGIPDGQVDRVRSLVSAEG